MWRYPGKNNNKKLRSLGVVCIDSTQDQSTPWLTFWSKMLSPVLLHLLQGWIWLKKSLTSTL